VSYPRGGPLLPAPTITRCSGCGGWTWLIDTYGCNTCRALAAQTTDTERETA
jgi:hypothetical protein